MRNTVRRLVLAALLTLLASAAGAYFPHGVGGGTPSPPVISNISSGTPTSTTATIMWTTSTPSATTVNYGLTSGYGSQCTNGSLVTSHTCPISGLTASTTYHFDVSSTDAFAQTTTSGDSTFRTGSGSPPLAPWAVLELGGGGNASGIDISLAGVRFVIGDVYGGYLYATSDAKWHNVVTAAAMPVGSVGLVSGKWAQPSYPGVIALAGAPSDATKAYMYFGGCSAAGGCSLNSQNIFYSNNVDPANPDALTWCNASAGWANQNDVNSTNSMVSASDPGQFMAVDPYNPSHVIVGTPTGGLFESFNADACPGTFTAISTATIPLSKRTSNGNYPGYAIAFDSTGGSVTRSGHTVAAKAYVFSNGQYATGATINTAGSGYGNNVTGGTLTYSASCGIPIVLTVNTNSSGAVSAVTGISANANCTPLPSSSATWTPGGGLTTPSVAATFNITGTSAGVYKTTDGGANWTETASGPTTVKHIHVSPASAGGGHVWATDETGGTSCDGSTHSLWYYDGTWSHTTGTSTLHFCDVAIDPSNGDHVVANGNNGGGSTQSGLWATTTGSTGWNSPVFSAGYITPGTSDGDAAWQATTTVNGAGITKIGKGLAITPTGGTLITNIGQGTFTASFPGGSDFRWVGLNKGIQGLVGGFAIGVPAQQTVIVGAQDEASCNFDATNPTTATALCGPLAQFYNGASHLSFASGLSIVPGANFAIAKISSNFGLPDYSGYSTNGFTASGNYQTTNYNPADYLPFNRWYSVIHSGAMTNNGSGAVRIDLNAATSGATDTSALNTFAQGDALAAKSIICVTSTGNFDQSSGLSNPLCFPVVKVSPGGVTNRYIDLTGSPFSAAHTANNYILWVPSKPLSSYWGEQTIENVTSDGGLVKITVGPNSFVSSGSVVCIGTSGWTGSAVTMSGVGTPTTVNGCWVVSNFSGNTFDLVGSSFGTDSYVSGGIALADPGPGGAVAAADASNWALLGANADMPICTTNAGADWTPILTADGSEFASQLTTTTAAVTAGTSFITANGTLTTGAFVAYVVKLDSGRWWGFSLSSVTGSAGSFHLNLAAGQTVPLGDGIAGTGAKIYSLSSGSNGWIQGVPFVPRRFAVDPDPSTPNTFYAINFNGGLYKWTHCGALTKLLAANSAQWTKRFFNGAAIKTVPGEKGHLFAWAGPFLGSDASTHPGISSPNFTNHLQRFCDASNSSATAQAVYGMYEPYAVGFGPPAPGKAYDTVYVAGWYDQTGGDNVANAVWGIWESIDDPNHGITSACDVAAGHQTWTNIGTLANNAQGGTPLGWNIRPYDISGDPFVHGPLYYSGTYGVFGGVFP